MLEYKYRCGAEVFGEYFGVYFGDGGYLQERRRFVYQGVSGASGKGSLFLHLSGWSNG